MKRGDTVTLEWPEEVVTEFVTNRKMLTKAETWTGTVKSVGGGRTACVDFGVHGTQFVPLSRLTVA